MACEQVKHQDDIGSPLVLLIEDHPLLALTMKAALEEGGYQVIIATDGKSALQCLRDGLQPTALVTDIGLGDGADGSQLALCARRNNPLLPVVYISGDIHQESAEEPVRGGVMLQKPFSPDGLLSALFQAREASSINPH